MSASGLAGAVDTFSVLRHAVMLSGWCQEDDRRIAALELRPAQGGNGNNRTVTPLWLPSPDVAAVRGPQAAACRFDVTVYVGPAAAGLCGGEIAAVCEDGARVPFATLGVHRPSAASALTDRFVGHLATLDDPDVLEVGARARSGISRRDWMPPGARYTGCDILPGENVDVVCDAHALSTVLPLGRFNAVFAISVLEHLLMPWKFAIELNRVLAPGAIGLIATHQCWPMHDMPWDFWRVSDQAWRALFNAATGFEILATAMGEPAYIIAQHCHPATNFGPQPAGFLASSVLFRKTGETQLAWNVPLSDLVASAYPA